jgi:sigma-54 dependent transcriptional regulator, acetoin dehydrogenase operon transcriptional activator AcoR
MEIVKCGDDPFPTDEPLASFISRIRKAWDHYSEGRPFDAISGIRAPVRESWKLCSDLAVDPLLRKAPDVLGETELFARQQSFAHLATVDYFFQGLEHLTDSSEYIVAVADADGYLLKIMGNAKLLAYVTGRNFTVGAKWGESTTGTNAIGTSIRTGKTAEVVAAEHFCEGWHGFACTATPIRYLGTGRILGTIDVTSRVSKFHPHNRALTESLVRAVEREIYLKNQEADEWLTNCFLEALSSQSDQRLILLDREGRIRRACLKGSPLNGMNQQNLKGKLLKDVLTDLDDVGLLRTPESRSLQDGIRAKICPLSTHGSYVGALIHLDAPAPRKKSPETRNREVEHCEPIGRSSSFMEILTRAKDIAQVDCNTCIEGETGTGKGVLAHFLHSHSRRKDKPLIVVNCGTIPKDLACSELFGYEFGAFTGAKKNGHEGKFQAACGGTIFLDEISELSLEAQAVLLHVTEDRFVTPLGSNRPRKIDVRIVVATNKSLKDEVQKGAFRKDLYYRFNVVRISLPPLRHRPEDVPLLAKHFVDHFARVKGERPMDLDTEALEALIAYDWPGNVRELKNAIEHAVIFCRGSSIGLAHLPAEIQCHAPRIAGRAESKTDQSYIRFLSAHKACSGNISRMAQMLGVSRPTIYKWKERFGLESHDMGQSEKSQNSGGNAE